MDMNKGRFCMKNSRILGAVVLFLLLSGCAGNRNSIKQQEALSMSIYDISVKDMNNNDVSLSDYKGKVLLVVNTATLCGFTPQYAGLQELYTKYCLKGFEILDFPCNQFMNQAPGTIEEIHAACTTRFGITFNQFAKIDVNGDNESPLYTLLKAQAGGGDIGWNFVKFLVDRKGNIVKRYDSPVTPEKIAPDIEEQLKNL
jgi:glutathione peroxidase